MKLSLCKWKTDELPKPAMTNSVEGGEERVEEEGLARAGD